HIIQKNIQSPVFLAASAGSLTELSQAGENCQDKGLRCLIQRQEKGAHKKTESGAAGSEQGGCRFIPVKQSASRSHDEKNPARDAQAAAGGENLCRCGKRIHILSSRTQSPGSQYASEEGEKIRKKRYGGKAVCAHKDAHQSVAEDPFREEGEQKSHKADGEQQRAGPQTFFH